jgi:hypothetical protein
MITFNVNWFAVAASAVANMVVGALWYGPLLGRPWMDELGFTMEDVEGSEMGQAYLIAAVNSVLMAFVMANVVAWAGATGVGGGLLVGLMMWLGFTGFTFAANHAFEGRSLRLWAINALVYLVGLLIMGVILAVWQ